MNQDQMEGKWKQWKGAAKEQWGELTDDDLEVIAGRQDKLIGKIQERYGIAKAAAKREADAWLKTMESSKEEAGTRREREMAGKR